MAQGTGTILVRFLAVLVASVLMTACATGTDPSNLEQRRASVADTPLMAAVGNGNLERTRSLAASGMSLNTLTEVGTPLSAAVRAGEDRIVWFLLSEGAAPDLATVSGVTPLMIASMYGKQAAVEALLGNRSVTRVLQAYLGGGVTLDGYKVTLLNTKWVFFEHPAGAANKKFLLQVPPPVLQQRLAAIAPLVANGSIDGLDFGELRHLMDLRLER